MDISANTRLPPPAQRLLDLAAAVDFLRRNRKLVHVRSEVDPVLELAGIARRFEGRECVLFERVRGSPYPVLAGVLWNRDTVGGLFGVSAHEVPFVISRALAAWQRDKQAMPCRMLESGPANEVIESEVDLSRLPIPHHALKDGGRYLDSSVVVARNPETGVCNVSIHRMMVVGKDRLTFVIDPERHIEKYAEIAERRGEPLPLTINNGIGLAPWIVSALPRTGDGKHTVAHHLLGQPIDWIMAQSVDVPAYSEAQFVIEAELIPGEREDDGPFAEVTGYYAGRARLSVLRVKAITRRETPIYQTILSGHEVWNAVGFTAEAAIFNAVRARIPEVTAVFLPPGGCGFYEAIVTARNTRPGIAKDVIREAFRAFHSLQRVVVVDTDVDIHDPVDVDWAISTRFNPDVDIVLLPGETGHIRNPMVRPAADGKGGTVTKFGMDAMVPFGAEKGLFERVSFQDVDLAKHDIDYP